MTISKEERKRALDEAFKFIGDTVGDGDFTFCEFDADMPGFAGLPKTTKKELEHYGILKRAGTIFAESYDVTANGWIEVLRATGQLQSHETERRAGILASALKAHVKGREEDEIVQTDVIVSEVAARGVPEGWVYSALHSSLLSALWPSRRMNVYLEEPMCAYVHVPALFGMDDDGVID